MWMLSSRNRVRKMAWFVALPNKMSASLICDGQNICLFVSTSDYHLNRFLSKNTLELSALCSLFCANSFVLERHKKRDEKRNLLQIWCRRRPLLSILKPKLTILRDLFWLDSETRSSFGFHEQCLQIVNKELIWFLKILGLCSPLRSNEGFSSVFEESP